VKVQCGLNEREVRRQFTWHERTIMCDKLEWTGEEEVVAYFKVLPRPTAGLHVVAKENPVSARNRIPVVQPVASHFN